MDNLLYYLPEIIFGALVLIALIWGILFVREMKLHSKGKTTCIHCKGLASKVDTPDYLFLLPISFGDKYSDSENYLRSHMQPILSKKQIPTGRRACHMEVYQCPKCGKKQVMITDFLQVRMEENVEKTYFFSYETFQHLINRWEILGARPAANS